MNERAIKDLCIAWEALSRIPGGDAEHCSLRINSLIRKLIEENEHPLKHPTHTTKDNEIPF